jgi:hypothetical protein
MSTSKTLRSDEPIATFEMTIPAARAGKFFAAVGWGLARRPAMPPTLATIFREGEFVALHKVGLSLKNILHGEQKYRTLRDLVPERRYRCTTTIKSQHEKAGKGGTMYFYVLETDIADDDGVCVECLTTIIARKE